jgi:hypothetical protein
MDGLFATMAFPNRCSEYRSQATRTNDHTMNIVPSGVTNFVSMQISRITWNKVALSSKANPSVFIAKTSKWNEQPEDDEQQ